MFNPKPNATPRCEELVLATTWAHYKVAKRAGLDEPDDEDTMITCAEAVRRGFWAIFRVAEEHKAKANEVFEEAAKDKVRNVIYEPKWLAITDYHHHILKEPISKKEAMRRRSSLRKDQYALLIPSWANGMPGAWEALVDRWIGLDEAYAAVSRRNKSNRGSDGTHSQGNRSHNRQKEHNERVMGQPLTDMQSFEMARVRKVPKKGKGPYYGAVESNLNAYKEEFRRWHGEDLDPLLCETDETAVVLS